MRRKNNRQLAPVNVVLPSRQDVEALLTQLFNNGLLERPLLMSFPTHEHHNVLECLQESAMDFLSRAIDGRIVSLWGYTATLKDDAKIQKSVASYIKQMVVTEILSTRRKHRKQSLTCDIGGDENWFDFAESDVDSGDVEEWLEWCRPRLTEIEFKVLRSRYRDSTFKVVAEELGISETSARNYWKRIQEKLAPCLEEFLGLRVEAKN